MQKYISLLLTLAFLACFSVQANAQSRKELKKENQKLQRQVDSLENELSQRIDKILQLAEETNRNQKALAAKPQEIYDAARNDNEELFEALMFNYRHNPDIAKEIVTVSNTETPVRLPLFCAVATTNNVAAVKFFVDWGIVAPVFVCSHNANNEWELVTQYASKPVLEYLIDQNFLIADDVTLLRGYCALGCMEDNTVCSNYVKSYSDFLEQMVEKDSVFSSFASDLLQKSYKDVTQAYCVANSENSITLKLWWMK